MQDIFYIVAGFVVYVIAQSFVINGIKIASSGETETRPDGSLRHSPMILYPIARWVNKSWDEKVYYKGAELDKFLDDVFKEFKHIIPEGTTQVSGGMRAKDKESFDLLVGIAKTIEKRGKVKYTTDGNGVIFYKEYKRYYRSKWIRMPTFGCIRCMSSFWSLGTYWYPMIALFGFSWWMVPLWVANISAVTFVNTYISQRYTE